MINEEKIGWFTSITAWKAKKRRGKPLRGIRKTVGLDEKQRNPKITIFVSCLKASQYLSQGKGQMGRGGAEGQKNLWGKQNCNSSNK
jgi:hypothetical protein